MSTKIHFPDLISISIKSLILTLYILSDSEFCDLSACVLKKQIWDLRTKTRHSDLWSRSDGSIFWYLIRKPLKNCARKYMSLFCKSSGDTRFDFLSLRLNVYILYRHHVRYEWSIFRTPFYVINKYILFKNYRQIFGSLQPAISIYRFLTFFIL